MSNDDAQIGRLLSRREWLMLCGGAGAIVLGSGLHVGFAHALPACVARPRQTEGPYFVDEKLNRSDIRPDPRSGALPPGVQLDLVFNVFQLNGSTCRPLGNALVDLWQCDALGVYSDVRDTAGRFDTRGQQFLRGHQLTDADGQARFVTIYPGWYEGRTVHIHFKVRTQPRGTRGYDFTSQLYFDDRVTDQVMRRDPYSSKGERSVRNERDGIYRRGGDQLMLVTTNARNGYAATFDIALELPS